jgi:uncharacterized protein YuzE
VEKAMNKKPLINYDTKSDILYIVTKKGKEAQCTELAPGINVEVDEKGKVIGIEILHASHFLKPIAKPLYDHIQMV